jgi:hypothetical protein
MRGSSRTPKARRPWPTGLLKDRIPLTRREFRDLVEFVRDALFDERILRFCRHLPRSVPSGMPLPLFEGCE